MIWTRLLGLLLGATVYTFSIILAVFLVGIGHRQRVRRLAGRDASKPRGGSGDLPVAAGGRNRLDGIACIANSVPWWPVNPLLSTDPWFTFQIDLVRVIWTILPATLLWGASFPWRWPRPPITTRIPAAWSGGIYAANTGGAIVGALAFSMILVPLDRDRGSEQVLIVLAAVGALVVLVPAGACAAEEPLCTRRAGGGDGGGGLSCVANVYGRSPGMLIAYGRRIMTPAASSKILYTGEGINSSIAISQWNDGAIQFHVSGKVEASTEPYDMRLQRMLGHMPALVHTDPKSVLIVGFGAGVTAGSFVTYPAFSAS